VLAFHVWLYRPDRPHGARSALIDHVLFSANLGLVAFFVDALGFELVEDEPALTTSTGRRKRWVMVRPPGGQTGLLLAKADGERQQQGVGDQFAGRVGLFLRVEDFGAQYERMTQAGVEFVSEPRDEPYGRVAVFVDIAGNRWDLLGPAAG
jgi:catechol 2,3-dioxygenase-like lactoylglutathione lyase family enzyme